MNNEHEDVALLRKFLKNYQLAMKGKDVEFPSINELKSIVLAFRIIGDATEQTLRHLTMREEEELNEC